jgi:hypothetical protein
MFEDSAAPQLSAQGERLLADVLLRHGERDSVRTGSPVLSPDEKDEFDAVVVASLSGLEPTQARQSSWLVLTAIGIVVGAGVVFAASRVSETPTTEVAAAVEVRDVPRFAGGLEVTAVDVGTQVEGIRSFSVQVVSAGSLELLDTDDISVVVQTEAGRAFTTIARFDTRQLTPSGIAIATVRVEGLGDLQTYVTIWHDGRLLGRAPLL